MSITYPLDLPTSIGFGSVTFTARNVTGASTSPFTFKQQILQWPGQRWEAEVTLPPMKRDLAEDWITFLMSLKGRVGTFLLNDPNATEPQGDARLYSDTLLLNGATAIGDTSLSIDGAEPSVTDYLKAGDYIQVNTGVNSTLHKVLVSASSNVSGEVDNIEVWPDFRSVVADNTSVSVSSAKGLFRLDEPEMSYSIDNISSYGISFKAVEVI